MLVGFFAGEGSELEAIPHAVAPAWAWPSSVMARELEKAGFDVVKVTERQEPGARPHAGIEAVRTENDS